MKSLRGGPLRVVGHFHSHPGGPPEPSETDRRAAYEADLIWLIVALRGPDEAAPVVTAWSVEGPVGEDGAAGFRPLRLRTDATA
jgi:proteasome lid subunit RPN8/RPN11